VGLVWFPPGALRNCKASLPSREATSDKCFDVDAPSDADAPKNPHCADRTALAVLVALVVSCGLDCSAGGGRDALPTGY
jgi:hypothetical protein